jgi:alcohol dehydrogenase
MKAVVFHRPKDVRIERVDDPRIEDARDVILRVTSTSICGSDLHIYNGLFPQLRRMVPGHEFMGIVEDVGAGVQKLKRNDRVVIPCAVACGECWFCQHHLPTACERSNPRHYGPEGATLSQKGGGIYGYAELYGGYRGGQAEAVRVLFADNNARKVPDDLSDEQALFLSDILPAGWTAIDWADLKGGETVAVFGCGPVGLMAQKCAWLRGAERVIGLDVQPYRLEAAKRVARSETVNVLEQDAVAVLREMTGGRGPDVCVDAVGMEADRNVLEKVNAAIHLQRGTMKALNMAISAVRRGGTVSVVGAYGTSYDNFPLGKIFDKGLKVRFGQAPVQNHIDRLLVLIREQRIQADDIISHMLPLDQAPSAYSIFNKKLDECLKVVLKP